MYIVRYHNNRYMRYLFYTLFFFLLNSSFSVLAQEEIIINEKFESIELEPYFFYSPKENLTAQNISTKDFIVLPKDLDIQNKLKKTTWFKFKLSNKTNNIKDLTFTIGNIHFRNYALYKENKKSTFLLFKFTKDKVSKTHNFYLSPNEDAIFYLKAQHTSINYRFKPLLSSTNSYTQKAFNKNLISTSFYGAGLFLFVFNLILFFYFKETYLLFYALYIFFYTAFSSIYEGLFETTLFLNHRQIGNIITISFILLSYVFTTLFLTKFLNTKKHLPKLHKASRVLIISLTLLVLLNFTSPIDHILNELIMLPSFISMLFILTLTIVSVNRKIHLAKMVLYSYVWLISCGILSLLLIYNITPLTINGDIFLKIGLLGELIILTFAIIIYLFETNNQLKGRVKDELKKSYAMNKQLEEKQTQLKHLSGIKDRFLVNISHEIRTPLNAILGTTTLLNTQNLPDSINHHVTTIKTAGANLMGIIDDILSFKILTKDEININISTFNISEELEKICLLHKEKITAKSLFFDFYNLLDYPDIRHKGDLQKILKSVNILLDNALKYTQKGNIEITLSSIEVSPNSDAIKIIVKDTGKGVKQSQKEHIFKSFAQENEEYTREFGGLGMGLAVFDKIIGKLNGEIIFESKQDQGSTFGFTLPLDKIGSLNNAKKEENKPLLTNEVKILLVEDDRINQLIATQFLEKTNRKTKIMIANNGKEAVTQLENEVIDIIFMDLQMPVMNGYEATEIIRNLTHKKKKKTPIIALTAHTQNSERIKCQSYGMNGFVSKPYTIKDLEHVITLHIQ